MIAKCNSPADMKTCRKCRVNIAQSGFHKDRSRKDGLSNVCKECDKNRYSKIDRSVKNAREKAARQAVKALVPPKPVRTEKRCYACKKTLAISMFPTYRKGKSIVHSGSCRPCAKILNKAWIIAQGEALKRKRADQERHLRETLDEKYIRHQLSKRSGLKRASFPASLVELKGEQLAILRLSKQLNTILQENSNGTK